MLKTVLSMGLALGGGAALLAIVRQDFNNAEGITEPYALGVAVLFTIMGVLLGRRVPVRPSGKSQHASNTVANTSTSLNGDPASHAGGSTSLAGGSTTLIGASNALVSARELEVLELLREGLTNQEIAERLFVSTNTVKTHLASIYSKMNVRRRTEAIKRANDLGLLVNHPIG